MHASYFLWETSKEHLGHWGAIHQLEKQGMKFRSLHRMLPCPNEDLNSD